MPAEPEPIPGPAAGIGRATGKHLCQAVEPLLISDVQAAAMCGLSRASWHRLAVRGAVPASVKLGRRRLWNRAEICAWCEAGCPDRRTWEAMKAAAGRRRIGQRGGLCSDVPGRP